VLAVQSSAVVAAVGVGALTAFVLWAMLRRGSVADRARTDDETET
jgi:hypothetical protein